MLSYSFFDATGSAQIIAAQPGKRIRVLGWLAGAATAGQIQWQSPNGVPIAGRFFFPAGSSLVVPIAPAVEGNQLWWFRTPPSQSLWLYSSVAVSGILVYDMIND